MRPAEFPICTAPLDILFLRNMKTSQLLLLVSTLVFASTVFVSAQPVVPFEDACLVYTARSTSKSSGYQSSSYGSAGMAVVGPEFVEEVEGYAGSGSPMMVPVKKRMVQNYYFFTDSIDKKKMFSASMLESRIAGTINLAKDGSTSKPSVSVALTYGDFATTSLSDTDVIGRASLKSPYAGGSPGWVATSLVTSYKSYDVNPDRDWENPDAPYKFVGQDGVEYVPCVIYSGKTTYALDAKLSEKTKGQSFEQACATVEASLEASGYEKVEPSGGPDM